MLQNRKNMSKKILIKLDPDPWRWGFSCSKNKADEFNKQLIGQLTSEGFIVKINTEDEQIIDSADEAIFESTCNRINEIMADISDPKQMSSKNEDD